MRCTLCGIVTLAIASVAAAIVALIVIYGGYFNVAATEPHTPFGRWLFSTTMKQSVASFSEGVEVPETLPPAEEGMSHYREHCEVCHGGPGVEPSPIGRGLRPSPPDLSESAEHWSPGELFWIIKHGIRMTGMPAWGEAYDDEHLWSLVAFVEALPEITPAEYQRGAEQQRSQAEAAHHRVRLTNALSFEPASLTINVGDTVTWENTSSLVHTVTAVPDRAADPADVRLPGGAEPFNSGSIPPGQTFQHTFTVPGRYRYFCIPHEAAGMVAEITVKEPGASGTQ